MSKGYADFRLSKEMQNQPEWKPDGSPDDYSRIVLVIIIFISFGIGLYFFEKNDSPQSMVRSSAEKTLQSPFTASVEGARLLDGAEVDVFRSHESSNPGQPVQVSNASGAAPAPYNSREILELLRTASKVREMKREDMYGHPARHFSGEIPILHAGSGQPGTYRFDYWLDMMNRKAARLVVRGKSPSTVITVLGNSLENEVFLNIRWSY